MSCPEGGGYITEGLLEGNWRPARWPWPPGWGPQTRTAWAVAAARPLFCKSRCFKSSACSAQWALVCWDLCLTEGCLACGEVERLPGQVAPAPGRGREDPPAAGAKEPRSHHTCAHLAPIHFDPQPSLQGKLSQGRP